MHLPRFLSRALPLVLGLTFALQGRADTVINGSLAADDSVFLYNFTSASTQQFTFRTSSFINGGFLPVLTLFNSVTGAPLDYSDSGLGDVSISDILGNGSYVLALTEFPNVANGTLSESFVFAGSPTITGDLCNQPGKAFLNTITCSAIPLGNNYTLNVASVPASVTPEPSTALLLLLPTALMFAYVRRQNAL